MSTPVQRQPGATARDWSTEPPSPAPRSMTRAASGAMPSSPRAKRSTYASASDWPLESAGIAPSSAAARSRPMRKRRDAGTDARVPVPRPATVDVADGPRPARRPPRRPGRAPLPRQPGLGVDGARRRRLRRDDRPARGPAGEARRRGPVLDARARARGARPRRHRQGAVPHARRPARRGGAHALQGRQPVAVPVVAVGVPAELHVLRDGHDEVRAQPHRRRDPRPGAALPSHRARRPRRLHGHGRADDEPRRSARRLRAPARRRRHEPAHGGLDRRLGAGNRPPRREPDADPARPLPPRRRRRPAQRHHAGQRPLPAGRGARRLRALPRRQAPAHLRRVRHARGRQRPLRAGARARAAARPADLQGEPDSLQPDRDVRGVEPRSDRRVPSGPRGARPARDGPAHARARHRRRLRPAGREGMTLHHVVRGEGPAVLLVHAGIADGRMWEPLGERLVAAGYRIVAPDMRGFGRTPLTPGVVSNAADLVALLDELGISEAAVVGASFGGRVALELALRAPERVTALALLGSGLDAFEWSDDLDAFDAEETEALERGDVDAAVQANVRMWVTRDGRDVDPAVVELVATMQRAAFDAQIGVDADIEPHDPPGAERLHEGGAPALVVVGTDDVPDLHGIAIKLAGELPAAEPPVTIDDAAHLPALERPDAVAAVLLPFLDRHARA